MKRTFYIEPGDINKSDVLLCELSQNHVALAWANPDTKKLKGLSYYELRNLLEPEKLQDILNDENSSAQQWHRVIVSSGFKNVLLVPSSQFTEEGARRLFATTYNLNGDMLFYNEIPHYNLMLVHALPQGYMSVLKSLQPAETVHSYQCLLQSHTVVATSNQLSVHFMGKEFEVAAVKEEQLQVLQTYLYTTPLDVVYYLLSICQQFGLEQSGTSLVLSGMISEDSALYKELYQYFSDVRLWAPAPKTALQSEYPQHFFSSLYNLAACVL